jgi:hypothetical protein
MGRWWCRNPLTKMMFGSGVEDVIYTHASLYDPLGASRRYVLKNIIVFQGLSEQNPGSWRTNFKMMVSE